MPSILDQVNGVPVDMPELEGVTRETVEQMAPGPAPVGELGQKLADFLKTPTGDGSIDSYLDHPLNFDRTKEMSQVIRGITGLFGNINLAIADILIGGMRWMNLKKGAGSVGDN